MRDTANADQRSDRCFSFFFFFLILPRNVAVINLSHKKHLLERCARQPALDRRNGALPYAAGGRVVGGGGVEGSCLLFARTRLGLTASIGREVSTSKWHFNAASQGLDSPHSPPTRPTPNLLTTATNPRLPASPPRPGVGRGQRLHKRRLCQSARRPPAISMSEARPQFWCANPSLFATAPSLPLPAPASSFTSGRLL